MGLSSRIAAGVPSMTPPEPPAKKGNRNVLIAMIEGATRIVGQSQGYLGLPIRDETIHERVNGPGTPCMVTAWTPTPEELAALNAGASVHVRILGEVPAPMMVEVGPAPGAT